MALRKELQTAIREGEAALLGVGGQSMGPYQDHWREQGQGQGQGQGLRGPSQRGRSEYRAPPPAVPAPGHVRSQSQSRSQSAERIAGGGGRGERDRSATPQRVREDVVVMEAEERLQGGGILEGGHGGHGGHRAADAEATFQTDASAMADYQVGKRLDPSNPPAYVF